MRDLRHVLRTLRRSPAFALVAVSLLGFGIGAASVVFSVFDALMLRPLPAADPERLVRIVTVRPPLGPRSYFTTPVFEALQRESRTFSSVSGTWETNGGYTDGGQTERVLLAVTSSSFFPTFGVGAWAGKVFEPADDKGQGGTLPAVLSYDFWQRRYQSSRDVLGRQVVIHGQPFQIVGILPEGFNGATIESGPDVRVPLPAAKLFLSEEKDRRNVQFELVARLALGVSLPAAQEEAWGIFTTAKHEVWEREVRKDQFALESLARGTSRLRTQVGDAAIFAMAAVGILVLMLATNLSGMLLARFAQREHEFALRQALGASRSRLFRLAVVETAVLVAGGALLGGLLTVAGVKLATRALPPVRLLDNSAVPMALNIAPDWRVLAFSVALCFATMLLIALAPAMRAARTDVDPILRGTKGAARTRGRAALLAVQVALCTILLLGAGLVATTLERLRALDPGFAKDRVVSFSVDPQLAPGGPKNFGSIAEQWHTQVEALPGVRSAAFSAIRLLRGSGRKITIAPAGDIAQQSDFLNVSNHGVGREYFDTLGLKLVEGRFFSGAEYQANPSRTPKPIIVNQAFARRFGPPLGRKFGGGLGVPAKPDFEVIGVVNDAKYRSMREPIHPTMYGPLDPQWGGGLTLLVRTDGRPAGIVEPVRAALRSLVPDLPVEEISTLEEDIEDSLWSERATAWLASAFAILAAIIVAAGLYGLLAYLVALRTREIGIRIAVGATPRDVLSLISREALRPVLIGLVTGLILGLVFGRVAEALLFGVSSRDPLIIAGVALTVLLVGVAAAGLPALRAARLQPSEALRQE